MDKFMINCHSTARLTLNLCGLSVLTAFYHGALHLQRSAFCLVRGPDQGTYEIPVGLEGHFLPHIPCLDATGCPGKHAFWGERKKKKKKDREKEILKDNRARCSRLQHRQEDWIFGDGAEVVARKGKSCPKVCQTLLNVHSNCHCCCCSGMEMTAMVLQ